MDSEIFLRGDLWKNNKLVGLFWAKKYFVLKMDCLELYKDQKKYESKKFDDIILLKEILSVRDNHKKDFSFKLVYKEANKTLEFKVKSEIEKKRLIEKLDSLMNEKKESKPIVETKTTLVKKQTRKKMTPDDFELQVILNVEISGEPTKQKKRQQGKSILCKNYINKIFFFSQISKIKKGEFSINISLVKIQEFWDPTLRKTC